MNLRFFKHLFFAWTIYFTQVNGIGPARYTIDTTSWDLLYQTFTSLEIGLASAHANGPVNASEDPAFQTQQQQQAQPSQPQGKVTSHDGGKYKGTASQVVGWLLIIITVTLGLRLMRCPSITASIAVFFAGAVIFAANEIQFTIRYMSMTQKHLQIVGELQDATDSQKAQIKAIIDDYEDMIELVEQKIMIARAAQLTMVLAGVLAMVEGLIQKTQFTTCIGIDFACVTAAEAATGTGVLASCKAAALACANIMKEDIEELADSIVAQPEGSSLANASVETKNLIRTVSGGGAQACPAVGQMLVNCLVQKPIWDQLAYAVCTDLPNPAPTYHKPFNQSIWEQGFMIGFSSLMETLKAPFNKYLTCEAQPDKNLMATEQEANEIRAAATALDRAKMKANKDAPPPPQLTKKNKGKSDGQGWWFMAGGLVITTIGILIAALVPMGKWLDNFIHGPVPRGIIFGIFGGLVQVAISLAEKALKKLESQKKEVEKIYDKLASARTDSLYKEDQFAALLAAQRQGVRLAGRSSLDLASGREAIRVSDANLTTGLEAIGAECLGERSADGTCKNAHISGHADRVSRIAFGTGSNALTQGALDVDNGLTEAGNGNIAGANQAFQNLNSSQGAIRALESKVKSDLDEVLKKNKLPSLAQQEARIRDSLFDTFGKALGNNDPNKLAKELGFFGSTEDGEAPIDLKAKEEVEETEEKPKKLAALNIPKFKQPKFDFGEDEEVEDDDTPIGQVTEDGPGYDMDELLSKKKDAGINKDPGASIFEILSVRYTKSALPRLFTRKKKKVEAPPKEAAPGSDPAPAPAN